MFGFIFEFFSTCLLLNQLNINLLVNILWNILKIHKECNLKISAVPMRFSQMSKQAISEERKTATSNYIVLVWQSFVNINLISYLNAIDHIQMRISFSSRFFSSNAIWFFVVIFFVSNFSRSNLLLLFCLYLYLQ